MDKIKDFVNKNYKIVIGIIIGITISVGIGVSAVATKDITYDNSTSGLTSTNLQGAIDELNEKAESISRKCKLTSGTGINIGTEIKCGTEYFYVISKTDSKVSMLSKYHIEVGSMQYNGSNSLIDISNPSRIQNSECLGLDSTIFRGESVTGACIGNNYRDYDLSSLNIDTSSIEVRYITLDELNSLGCNIDSSTGGDCNSSQYYWLKTGYYWLWDGLQYCGFAIRNGEVECVQYGPGTRPVITIPTSYIRL